VIDPRRIGLANKADLLLQVRPGTDGALALAFIHLLIENHWLDETFVRAWTNAPLLVRDDTGRLLLADDLHPDASPGLPLSRSEGVGGSGPERSTRYVALEAASARLVTYSPAESRYDAPLDDLALRGSVDVRLRDGSTVRCRTVFDGLAELAQAHRPAVAAEITGVPEPLIHEAARLIASHRPVSHYLYNGLVQHTNATQACRAIAVFYALLGDFDRQGGNVIPPRPTTLDIAAKDVLPAEQDSRRIGRETRPLGPAARTR
jgi:anaerobic selenocysteine-containing dehydrogenase